MSRALNVVFVGVGGQGVLSAAGFLGEAAFRAGMKVAVSQLHGMSQRGGSVQAAVTIGTDRVLSPANAQVDVLVGLELIEIARMLDRVDRNTVVLASDQLIPPAQLAVTDTAAPTRDRLLEAIQNCCGRLQVIDALSLAKRAGHQSSLNAVMLGAFSALPECPVDPKAILAVMLQEGAPKARDFNRKAFALGREVAEHPALVAS
jgi:indolepyruvate ferredoxin oxidoreductase beta subunit